MISSMSKKLSEKKEYLWFCPETDEVFTLRHGPAPGKEEKAHGLKIVNKESGEVAVDLQLACFFIGEF